MPLDVKISHCATWFPGMVGKLKEVLETEFADKIAVTVNPVPSENAPKVYTIELGGELYFDWIMEGQDVKVKKAPNDKWQTPVNFETHEQYFGPHKPWQVDELKEAIKAKV